MKRHRIPDALSAHRPAGQKGRRFAAPLIAILAAGLLAACSGNTNTPTNLEPTTATLQATASCNGSPDCGYWFQWGPVASYATGAGSGGVPNPSDSSSPVYSGYGNTGGNVSLPYPVTSLTANTTYDYQLCGWGDSLSQSQAACVGYDGNAGSVQQFTTPIWSGDFSDQTASSPTVNPLLTGSPHWWLEQGYYDTNQNSYPYANQTLYPEGSLPSGMPSDGDQMFADRMVGNDSDAAESTCTVHPPYSGCHQGVAGTNLISPQLLGGNTGMQDAYVGFSELFDSSFPTQPSNLFYQFMEIFGLPSTSPSIYMGAEGPGQGDPTVSSQSIALFLGAGTSGIAEPWSTPLTRNQWENFQLHIVAGTTPTTGSIQLWVNGVAQTFNGAVPAGSGDTGLGTTTLHMATMRDNTNEQSLYLNSYSLGGWASGNHKTTWTGGGKIGSTLDSVAP